MLLSEHCQRETCKICFRANPVGFHVPDEIWNAVVPTRHTDDVLCIMCFAQLGDEKLIPWETQIELFPVSQAGLHDIWSYVFPSPGAPCISVPKDF